jgi:NAD dependent epimerase/dehydratase family enzyme
MADDALMSSARVEPAKLLGSRFTFRFPNLEQALRALLHWPPTV